MENEEKRAILRARSIGPKMLAWIEEAGYERLADFTRETPENIAFRIEAVAGIKLNRNGLKALRNLIDWSREAGS
ncbi:MAG: hypothetical protein WAU86_04165 [Oricola sp.]